MVEAIHMHLKRFEIDLASQLWAVSRQAYCPLVGSLLRMKDKRHWKLELEDSNSLRIEKYCYSLLQTYWPSYHILHLLDHLSKLIGSLLLSYLDNHQQALHLQSQDTLH